MKLLIISPFFPYANVPHAGGKFTYEIIKGLSKNHEIDLLARIEPEEVGSAHEMKAFCKRTNLYYFKTPIKSGLLSILKIIFSYYILAKKANKLIENGKYDLVHVEHTQTGLFLKRTNFLPLVLMAHDVITKPASRTLLLSTNYTQKMINLLKLKITKIIEKYISGKFKRIFLFSNIDKKILLKLNRSFKVSIIPYPVTDIQSPVCFKRNGNVILFCGAMNRLVNIEAAKYFATKIFPQIQQKVPDANFYIIGNKPPPEILQLSHNNAKIIVTGFVEDLKSYFLKASVFVSPLWKGGGIIVKNLQAMLLGVPVVTTSIGNEGIDAEPGKEVLIADDPVAFVDTVVFLLKNLENSRQIAKKARKYVLKNFTIESVIEIIESNYIEAIGGELESASRFPDESTRLKTFSNV